MQPPYNYPQQPYPPVTDITVNVQQHPPNFLLRVIYYIFIGWWFGYLWLILGFGLVMLIVTLPIGLVMLNRLPTVLTLRPTTSATQTQVTIAQGVMQVNMQQSGTQQMNMLARAVYFLFVGWWFGFLWANVGYLFCLFILTLPLGLIMLNRLPAVLTLRRN